MINKAENSVVIYQSKKGETQIDVLLQDETVWLTQAQISTLFERDSTVITLHINKDLKKLNWNEEQLSGISGRLVKNGN